MPKSALVYFIFSIALPFLALADEYQKKEVPITLKIKQVRVVGNKGVSSKEALDGTTFKAGLTLKAEFQNSFEHNLKVFLYNFLNSGYAKAKVLPAEMKPTGRANEIELILRVEEGSRYSVGKVSFKGDFIVSEDELLKINKMKNEKFFSYLTLQKDLEAINEKLVSAGYRHSDIVPITTINESQKSIDVVISINKGEKDK